MFNKKRNPDVMKMLLAQCEQAENAIEQLVEYMTTHDPALAEAIDATEENADKHQAILADYVENTFITPLSRHYLFSLSRLIDDVTDAILDLKDFLVFFDYAPREKDIEMARLCAESIRVLAKALREWDDTDRTAFWNSVKATEKNKEKIKRMYWEDVRQIVQADSIQSVITSREFCRDLRSLAEKIKRVADRLGDLKIKSIK